MYNTPITRENPTAFIILIDRSGSMTEQIVFADQQMTKARAVSIVASAFIDELLHRARREEGTRDYYDIAVLGYGGDRNSENSGIESLVSPPGKWARPSRLTVTKTPRKHLSRERLLPSGRSVMAVTRHNVWVQERAEGATPMYAALTEALKLVEKWCLRPQHAASYPPTIINITDGEASDGSQEEIRTLAEKIRATGTDDGNTLLINIHLAKNDDATGPILFPKSLQELPAHRYAQLLWDISSEMPAGLGRGMGWCSRAGDIVAMMNIGSQNSTML